MSSNEQLILLQKEFEILKNQQSLLEIEADAIYSELTSPGLNGESPAGINDPLVDKDDFPRGDIDMFNVKRKRQRLRVINTGQ